MTLTSWFRDYLFYPLEFRRRRVKFLRQETNTILVLISTVSMAWINIKLPAMGIVTGCHNLI